VANLVTDHPSPRDAGIGFVPVARARGPRLCFFAALLLGASDAGAYNPAAGDFTKIRGTDLRVLTWNTERNIVATASTADEFDRVLKAIRPDIIGLQEVPIDVTAPQLAATIGASLPIAGGTWQVVLGKTDGFIRPAIVSRYPLSLARTDTNPASEVRGVTMALVDLPNAAYAADFYFMVVHLKCCSGSVEEARRRTALDAMTGWLRDARTPGGVITLPANTPFGITGDFNLNTVDSPASEAAFLIGDIASNAIYGADSAPDWDGTPMTEARSADPFTGDTDTWNSSTTNPSVRFDRLYYSDSAAPLGAKFVFNPRTMPSSVRGAIGVNQTDVSTATDHLPVIFDVQVPLVVRNAWTLR